MFSTLFKYKLTFFLISFAIIKFHFSNALSLLQSNCKWLIFMLLKAVAITATLPNNNNKINEKGYNVSQPTNQPTNNINIDIYDYVDEDVVNNNNFKISMLNTIILKKYVFLYISVLFQFLFIFVFVSLHLLFKNCQHKPITRTSSLTLSPLFIKSFRMK